MNKHTKVLFNVLDVIMIFVLTFGSPMSALADPSPTGATIVTDLPDYPAGSTVIMTGAGWAANEGVHIVVNADDGSWTLESIPDPIADGSGGFTYEFQLPNWYVPSYTVAATGFTSGTATVTFTDPPPDIQNIWQCDPPSVYDPSTYTCVSSTNTGWVTGNNDGPFFEGETIPYRTRFQNLVSGNQYSVTIEWDTTKDSKHALDYLKSFNATITAAQACASLSGLPAGLCSGTPDTEPIPADLFMQAHADWVANGGVQDPGDFTMFGGTITSLSPYTTPGSYAGNTSTSITVFFTATSTDMVLAWGGHISSRADWGLDNSAVAIPGSPYHMRILSWFDVTNNDNNNVGNMDRSLSADAVIFPASITIIKEATPEGSTSFPFTASPSPLSDFSLVDDGTSANTKLFSNITNFTTYTVAEDTPSGWTLTGVVCTVSGGISTTPPSTTTATVAIDLKEGDNVICTYTNQQNSQDLSVSKTASTSFNRSYQWLIDKSVNDTQIEIADGGTATFNYTVTVTPNGFTNSDFAVSGTITVTNPNYFDVMGVDVTDALNQGGSCSVTNGTDATIPAGQSVDFSYTCTSDGTSTNNTATASWDQATYGTPSGSASGDAGVSFAGDPVGETNKVITVIDNKTDPSNPVELGTSDYFLGPFTFEYSLDKQGVAGTCTDYTNTAVIDETDQSDSQTVTVCVGSDLTVTKTATASKDRLYKWLIDKSVDDTYIEIAAGGTATFNYDVKVTPDGFTDSGFTLGGTITINNPNDWEDVTVNVADTLDLGGTCSITETAPYVVPADDSLVLHYTCTTNGSTTKNTATVTWDKALYFTPGDTASDDANVTFGLDVETNKVITVVDDKTDPLNPVELGTWDWADGPHTFEYSLDKQGVAGTCTDYTNTAVIDETDQSDSQTVTVCVGSDLTVTKTATTSFTRTYAWTIEKSVDKTKVTLEGTNPQSATFNYTVAVSHDAGTDSAWAVSGTITVSNPNDWEAITADLTDSVNLGGGANCTVTNGTGVVVPASGSATRDYSCTFSSKPSYNGLNTATATWNAAQYFTPNDSATGTANVNFTTPTTIVDGSITVVDDKTDPGNPVPLGSASYTDASPKEFKYSLTKSGVSGACTDYTNTATFTTNTTGTTDSDEQTVTVCSSNVTVLKLTKGPGDPAPAVDPTQNWTFNIYTGPDGFGGSVLASDTTSGDADGLLDFDFYNLNPAKTYTICELNVPSGWTAEWKIDTNGDGTPDTVVIPYNPNSNDPVPGDLGNRCFDFGAGTSYPIPEGDTLAFQVINEFPGGAPRTPGYWKNWNRCTGGGQAANADRQGGRAEGFTLLEDILTSPGIIWDDIISPDSFGTVPITSCEQAVEILDQRIVKVNGIVGDQKKLASDGARTLAMHLLAAQLNEANGACINQDVKDVILKAETLLDKINFDGKKTTAYLTSKSADYAYALKLAAYLDAYNNSNCNFATLPPKP